ncbi:hypothetical protein [Nocardia sp. R6R-6]|uniref:hypothetical protein n=1 Tax=Nocardia sp. R6R-6 TaxID=3459303 RepID=UPI00403DDE07
MVSNGRSFAELDELVGDAERELRCKIRGYLSGIGEMNEPIDVLQFHALTVLLGMTAARSPDLHGRVEKMLSDVEETFPRLRNVRLGPRRDREPTRRARSTADHATSTNRNTPPQSPTPTPSERRQRKQKIEQQVQQMFQGSDSRGRRPKFLRW